MFLSKHLKFHKKYSAACHLVNSLLGVWISLWNTASHHRRGFYLQYFANFNNWQLYKGVSQVTASYLCVSGNSEVWKNLLLILQFLKTSALETALLRWHTACWNQNNKRFSWCMKEIRNVCTPASCRWWLPYWTTCIRIVAIVIIFWSRTHSVLGACRHARHLLTCYVKYVSTTEFFTVKFDF